MEFWKSFLFCGDLLKYVMSLMKIEYRLIYIDIDGLVVLLFFVVLYVMVCLDYLVCRCLIFISIWFLGMCCVIFLSV